MSILTNALQGSWLRRRETATLVASIAVLLAGHAPLCAAQSSDPTTSTQAEPAGQPTYASAEEAAGALFQATQSGSEEAVRRVLGSDDELVSSGDSATDKQDRERFVQKYQEMHRLARQPDGTTVLYIGAENWPFPVPLVARNGAWRFDADAGATEVLFRRIGENEIAAINMCHLLAAAQGQPDTSKEPAPPPAGSLINTLLSGAPEANKAVPFQGYDFRVLSRSRDGFTAIAYPAIYRSSGVMTFVVNQSNVVYEKDLGASGTRAAQTTRKMRPDSTWKPVEEPATP